MTLLINQHLSHKTFQRYLDLIARRCFVIFIRPARDAQCPYARVRRTPILTGRVRIPGGWREFAHLTELRGVSERHTFVCVWIRVIGCSGSSGDS